jgi:signal peptidase I
VRLTSIAVIAILSIILVSTMACTLGNSLTVNGTAMEPTIHDGQKIEYQHVNLDDLDRYDIIVFYYSSDQNQDMKLIKRIIGLPDEKIEITDGIVYINDAPLEESYVQGNTSTFSAIVLSDDQYFVMGDNRETSLDSRSFGPVDGDDIFGRVKE